MGIGEDFVGKILEHGERVSETAADGFKGVKIEASFDESFGRGVSTGTMELKIGSLTEAVDLGVYCCCGNPGGNFGWLVRSGSARGRLVGAFSSSLIFFIIYSVDFFAFLNVAFSLFRVLI